MSGLYRKKPVVIAATRWFKNGDHPDDHCPPDPELLKTWPKHADYVEWVEGRVVRRYRHPGVPGSRECEQCGKPHHDHGWIDTLEQGHRVCPGDWVITGVQGERYPCKPSIFDATYEPA